MAKVTAKIQNPAEGVSGDPVTVEYNFGETLEELTNNFGADVIASRARASLIIDLQAFIRRQINAKKTTKEIKKAVDEWKPGIKAAAKTPGQKLKAMLEGMSPEDKKQLLADAGIA